MEILNILKPDPAVITPDYTLKEAAQMMRELSVGDLPVVDGTKGKVNKDKILGMITDRDITIRATAEAKDPSTTTVQEIFTQKAICCYDDESVKNAFNIMQKNQIGRLLVKNRNDELIGIVSLADIIESVPDEIWDLLPRQQKQMQPA